MCDRPGPRTESIVFANLSIGSRILCNSHTSLSRGGTGGSSSISSSWGRGVQREVPPWYLPEVFSHLMDSVGAARLSRLPSADLGWVSPLLGMSSGVLCCSRGEPFAGR